VEPVPTKRSGPAINKDCAMATVKSLSDLKDKKVLVIFPHPDDETVMTGGLIQKLLSAGAKVTVVCLTSGDQGKIHIHGRGQSLGQIRRQEFFLAVRRLGVANFEIFNFPDGKLRSVHTWRPVVGEYVSHYDLVVSYDSSGVTGHPDHIALSLYLMKLARDTKKSLLLVAPVGTIRSNLLDSRVSEFAAAPELIIRLSLKERLCKWWALTAHKSQYQSSTLLLALVASLLPQTEGFAPFDPEKKYRFKHIRFEF